MRKRRDRCFDGRRRVKSQWSSVKVQPVTVLEPAPLDAHTGACLSCDRETPAFTEEGSGVFRLVPPLDAALNVTDGV